MDEFNVTFEMEKTFVLSKTALCVDVDGARTCSFPIKSGGSESVWISRGPHKMAISLDGMFSRKSVVDISVNQNGTIRLRYDSFWGKPAVRSLGAFSPNRPQTRGYVDGKIRLESEDEEFLIHEFWGRPFDATKAVREMTGADTEEAGKYVDELFERAVRAGIVGTGFEDFYERILSLPGADVFGTKKELRHLYSIMLEGEVVNAVSSGLMNNRTWLMASTNKRVILVNKNMFFGMQQMEIPLDQINAISYTSKILLSTITITHGASSMTIENVTKGSEKHFVEATDKAIREYKSSAYAANARPAPASAADEIKKFKELLDMGAITREEFNAKKKQLLGI